MAIFTKEKFETKSNEWATPADVFEPLNSEFDFGLDAAANFDNRKCTNYLGIDHIFEGCRDGLAVDWSLALRGTKRPVWLNPPFGGQLKKWVQKAYEESLKGITVVCLLPSRTNTEWWHNFCMKGEIRFIRGRPKFNNATHGLPFPLAIVIFRGIKLS